MSSLYDKELESAKKRALRILERMPRTEKQLYDKLCSDNKYSENTINSVINYAREYGFVNDRQYSIDYIEARKKSKSLKLLLYELKRKGVGDNILEELKESGSQEDSDYAIRHLIEKKGISPDTDDIKERQKLYRFLLSKGFTYHEISRVCSSIRDEM